MRKIINYLQIKLYTMRKNVIFAVIITSLVWCIIGYGAFTVIKMSQKIEQDERRIELSLEDDVYSYIFALRIEHPDIVFAQCIEESGNFKSQLFLQGNNCLGMKVPSLRPTKAVGAIYGHARFQSWKDCIADYAIWQSVTARRLSRDEYFALLDRIYAEKEGYSNRLKAIIKKNSL